MTTTEKSRNSSCLRYQVLQSIHCCRPIINMVSRIRVSFSRTSSCVVTTPIHQTGNYQILLTKYLDQYSSRVDKRHDQQKREKYSNSLKENVCLVIRVRELLKLKHTKGKLLSSVTKTLLLLFFGGHLDSDIKVEGLASLVLNNGLTDHILQVEESFSQVRAAWSKKE